MKFFIQFALFSFLLAALSVRAAEEGRDKIPDTIWAALTSASYFELLSLDPERPRHEKPKKDFHGWKILGAAIIKKSEVRDQLITALKKSADESNSWDAPCFQPRHGIRAISQGKTNDLVICFQCLQVLTIETDEKLRKSLITNSAQPVFNKVLRDEKIPFAKY